MFKMIGKFFVKIYTITVSPFLPHACKYKPTCSKYMSECIQKFGFIKGLHLGMKRICRCNPKSSGGKDLPIENIKGDYKWLL